MPELIEGDALHDRVVVDAVCEARQFVWIATADLKDMHIRRGQRYVPVLEHFAELARHGVRFRIVHSTLPTAPFRSTLETLPTLVRDALELQICPRSHWKMVVVDGNFAYAGSANFTGAGLGVKHADRRNFELGFVGREPAFVDALINKFDDFWMGNRCVSCRLRARCPDPIETELENLKTSG